MSELEEPVFARPATMVPRVFALVGIAITAACVLAFPNLFAGASRLQAHSPSASGTPGATSDSTPALAAEVPVPPVAYRVPGTPSQPRQLAFSKSFRGGAVEAVEDSGWGLRGRQGPSDPDVCRGRVAPVVGNGSMILSIGATWCVPCVRELRDLVALAARISPREDVKLVFVFTDDGEGENTLHRNQLELFKKHNDEYPSPDPLRIPWWMEFREDGNGRLNWATLSERLGIGRSELPTNMLFDACGNIRLVVTGPLENENLFESRARQLLLTPCTRDADGLR